MNDLLQRVYYNEELWLRNIGCEVLHTAAGVKVSHPANRSEDFNYWYPKDSAKLAEFSTIKVNSLTPPSVIEQLAESNFSVQLSFDVQLILDNIDCTKLADNNELVLQEVSQSNWIKCDEAVIRKWDHGQYHYFLFFVAHQLVGKMLCILSDDICGIYDFEIFKNYRQCGYSYEFLSRVVSRCLAKMYFIQTWSENFVALKLYHRIGFREIDRYNYFYSLQSVALARQS